MKKIICPILVCIMLLTSSLCVFAVAEKGTPILSSSNGNVTTKQIKDAMKIHSVLKEDSSEKYLSSIFLDTNKKFKELINPELTVVLSTSSGITMVFGQSLKDSDYEYVLVSTENKIEITKVKIQISSKESNKNYYYDYDSMAKIVNLHGLGTPNEIQFVDIGIKFTTQKGIYLYVTTDRIDTYGMKIGVDYYNFKSGNCYNYSDYEAYIEESKDNYNEWLQDKGKTSQTVDKDGDVATIDKTTNETTEIDSEKPTNSDNTTKDADEKDEKEPKDKYSGNEDKIDEDKKSEVKEENKLKDSTDSKINLHIGSRDIIINDKKIKMDVAPVIINDRTMLPIRFVAEALGANVEWNNNNQTVTITLKGDTIIVTIGKDFAYVNGVKKELDSPSYIENDRTYLPLRFVSSNLGAIVDWDKNTQCVTISK